MNLLNSSSVALKLAVQTLKFYILCLSKLYNFRCVGYLLCVDGMKSNYNKLLMRE